METPLRGKGFTQIEMVELAEALLESLPINTMEWECLQREKHGQKSKKYSKTKMAEYVEPPKIF